MSGQFYSDVSTGNTVVGGWIFVTDTPLVSEQLSIGSSIKWGVNQDRSLMRPGQKVFIWSSDGEPGIVAVGVIRTQVFQLGAEGAEDSQSLSFGATVGAWTVMVQVTNKFIERIYRHELTNVQGLKNLIILQNPHGTNYRLTRDEETRLDIYTTNPKAVIGSISSSTSSAASSIYIPDSLSASMKMALELKRNVIIEGCPGVGKTRIASQLAETVAGSKSRRHIWRIQFHQSFGYEDFVQGWRPNASGGFSMCPGIFLRLCSVANLSPDEKFVLIIEEINRGNISKIFGELFTLIEKDKRGPDNKVTLGSGPETVQSSDSESGNFFIPDNLYIIGTMNSSDRSTAIVDHALRRRFRFFHIDPAFPESWFKSLLLENGISKDLGDRICSVMQELNKAIDSGIGKLSRASLIGHSYFCTQVPAETREQDWLRDIVETEIGPLLAEYWPHDKEKVDGWKRKILG